MAKSLTNGFTEKQVTLYTDQYYERADLVFRFGALLTGSREGGERLTEETFRLLLEDFAQVKEETSASLLLMALAWKAWDKIKSERFHDWNVPILQSMKVLGVEQKAALFAIEMAGLDIKQASKIFGSDENTVRRLLADSQKHLAVSSIRV